MIAGTTRSKFISSAETGREPVRYFLNLFKRKKQQQVREGALTSEQLKERVNQIGVGKKVNITRLTYDGTPEDNPVSVKITDIRGDHFSGKVINVERSIHESQDERIVYVKGGGGSIEFYFDEGDIMKIEEDVDESIITQRNVEEIKEILDALDVEEDIMISYYDKNEGGMISGVGVLKAKDMTTLDFKVVLKIINEIELEEEKEVDLNLDKDNILDLEVVF